MQIDSAVLEPSQRLRRVALSFLIFSSLQSLTAAPESPEPKKPTPEQSAPVDDKTTAQIIEAEEQLAAAIQKHDTSAVDRLLGDQYLSSEEGAEWAISKRGALARCGLGKLASYQIELERRFRRDRQAVVLEGLARPLTGSEVEDARAQWMHITHYWIKPGDHWVLAAQTLPRRDYGEQEKD